MLAPLLFNMIFGAVRHAAEKRVMVDASAMDYMPQLEQKEKIGEKKGTSLRAK